MLINRRTIQSIRPNEELDDNAINSLLKIIQHESGSNTVLISESHFYVSLLDESDGSGFAKWTIGETAWKHGRPSLGGNIYYNPVIRNRLSLFYDL